MSLPDPTAAVRRHVERLMALPGVVGVAEGSRDGRPCVLVLVERRTAETIAGIPDMLEGLATVILETGTPEAFERS
jgi:hypothetical protein